MTLGQFLLAGLGSIALVAVLGFVAALWLDRTKLDRSFATAVLLVLSFVALMGILVIGEVSRELL